MSSSVKCISSVMFRFIISLVLIFKGVVVITSAQKCSHSSKLEDFYCNGNIEIKYPFWFDDNSSGHTFDYQCGYPGLGIKCVDNGTIAVMNISNQLYRASNIQHEFSIVTLKEMDIDIEECPHPRRNFSLQEFGSSLTTSEKYSWNLFYNCSNPPNNNSYLENFHVACLDNSGQRSYAFPGENFITTGFNWYGNCEETLVAPPSTRYRNSSSNYTIEAKQGFNLQWSAPVGDCMDCKSSGGLCSYYKNEGFRKCSCGSDFSMEFDKTCPPAKAKGLSNGVKVLIGVFTGFGVLLVGLVLTYITYRMSNIKSSSNVETFLESCGNLALQRFKYSDIKKMTNSFKEILGKGAYGCVFKGKLTCEGRLVAVKMLNESKGNGEDFINEVATIGRTNHVNVVSLLGFFIEGTKRALVYDEFMPNGSLERFIYNEKTSSTPLGLEKLYQIALGIAKGLDYLHRGCNMRILHFDIKPHNILLDQEFCPKISDFGLAKLCPTRESVVSMLVARGTIGYIAPEVYCRNFGGVSHKSDVYSYGMMVFEIIGGRKNIDPTVENMSEIYFPQWIYNHLKQDINVEGSVEILEDETTKKMIKVALWCIQTKPADRPSISKVVEMLEGSTEDLQMPPNPFHDSPSVSSP